MVGVLVLALPIQSQELAYIEPGLRQMSEVVSVIVTADSAETAAAAVHRLGGDGHQRLVADRRRRHHAPRQPARSPGRPPGIASITRNKGVETAVASDVYQWEGWVTDRRSYNRLPISLCQAT